MQHNGLKIVTWNVNGIRSVVFRQNGGLQVFLEQHDADIICVQETKLRRTDLTRDVAVAEGWESFWCCCKPGVGPTTGYSGVATFCRQHALPVSVEAGLSGMLGATEATGGPTSQAAASSVPSPLTQQLSEELGLSTSDLQTLDSEGRALVTDHGLFVLVNLYGPALTIEERIEERFAFKLNFYRVLEWRIRHWVAAGRAVVVVGDFNIAPHPVDSCKPKRIEDFVSRPDRQWLVQLLTDTQLGVTDVFRHFHPNRQQAYTCWNTASGARVNNWGTRIDHILVAGPAPPQLAAVLDDVCALTPTAAAAAGVAAQPLGPAAAQAASAATQAAPAGAAQPVGQAAAAQAAPAAPGVELVAQVAPGDPAAVAEPAPALSNQAPNAAPHDPTAHSAARQLLDAITACDIAVDVQGSDHAPVWISMAIPPAMLPSGHAPPAGAGSRMFPGKQASLRAWFQSHSQSQGQSQSQPLVGPQAEQGVQPAGSQTQPQQQQQLANAQRMQLGSDLLLMEPGATGLNGDSSSNPLEQGGKSGLMQQQQQQLLSSTQSGSLGDPASSSRSSISRSKRQPSTAVSRAQGSKRAKAAGNKGTAGQLSLTNFFAAPAAAHAKLPRRQQQQQAGQGVTQPLTNAAAAAAEHPSALPEGCQPANGQQVLSHPLHQHQQPQQQQQHQQHLYDHQQHQHQQQQQQQASSSPGPPASAFAAAAAAAAAGAQHDDPPVAANTEVQGALQAHEHAARAAWQRINNSMKPPLCFGHNEQCVIRTVKRKGPNLGRQFWCCARPDGPPPVGRCKHFQFANNPRKFKAAAAGSVGSG